MQPTWFDGEEHPIHDCLDSGVPLVLLSTATRVLSQAINVLFVSVCSRQELDEVGRGSYLFDLE